MSNSNCKHSGRQRRKSVLFRRKSAGVVFVPLLIAIATFETGCGKTPEPVGVGQPANVPATRPVASQPSVTFFGVKTEPAERVVYVINANGSMRTNWDLLLLGVFRSIDGLAETQSFSVILYRDDHAEAMVIDGKPGLLDRTGGNVGKARKWLRWIEAGSRKGIHDPNEALRRAFQMFDGRSGVIYLVDDGWIQSEPNKLLATLNARGNVKVNTIALVDRTNWGEKLMKDIAAQNGGQYRFVSEAELGR